MQEDDSTKDASSERSAAGHSGPLQYDIRVKGHLDARWASRFIGLRLTNEDDGSTLIHGPVLDQAALHGLLQQFRDMGMPLLSVTPVRADGADEATDQPSIHESNERNLT
jgi:hypothetical protein